MSAFNYNSLLSSTNGQQGASASLGGQTRTQCLIVGDFNVDLAKRDTAACRQLMEWMTSRRLTHVDVGATTDLVSKIDQIWANFDLGQPTQTLDCYYSDHKQLLVSMPDSFQHL